MPKYAISDIHGCARTLRALLDQIGPTRDDELYFLGDYIDRGPDSKGVIDTLLELRDHGHAVHCLMGNHELMMLEVAKEEEDEDAAFATDNWLANGGITTLQSYANGPDINFPDRHMLFLDELKFHFELPGYLLVHAGLNFLAADPLQDVHHLLWIRRWYNDIDRAWLGERVVVHGHTPVPRSSIEASLRKLDTVPAINIDCGCVYDFVGMGFLCALDLDSRKLFFQRNVDRGTR